MHPIGQRLYVLLSLSFQDDVALSQPSMRSTLGLLRDWIWLKVGEDVGVGEDNT